MHKRSAQSSDRATFAYQGLQIHAGMAEFSLMTLKDLANAQKGPMCPSVMHVKKKNIPS